MPGCSSDKAPLNLCVELLLSPGGSSVDFRRLAFDIELPSLDRRVERNEGLALNDRNSRRPRRHAIFRAPDENLTLSL
jgi:hypothetical protein